MYRVTFGFHPGAMQSREYPTMLDAVRFLYGFLENERSPDGAALQATLEETQEAQEEPLFRGRRIPEWFQQQWNGIAECVFCGGYQGVQDDSDSLLGHREDCPWTRTSS